MVLNQTLGLNNLRQDLNRLFYSAPVAPSTFGQGFYAPISGLYPTAAYAPELRAHFVPRCNWAETPEASIVTVELPGVELSQLSLRLEGAYLVLEGVRHPGGLIGDRMVSYQMAEGRFGTFRWACPIPNGTVAPQIEASFRNGLLTIVLPRVTALTGISPIGISTIGTPAMAQAPSAQVVITPGVNA